MVKSEYRPSLPESVSFSESQSEVILIHPRLHAAAPKHMLPHPLHSKSNFHEIVKFKFHRTLLCPTKE